MTGFKLNIGDPVVLDDETVDGHGKTKKRGGGYKITAITETYVECTHGTKEWGSIDKTAYFGKNDLHRIKIDKNAK